MDLFLISGAADIINSHSVEGLFNLGYQGKGLDNSGRFYPSDYEAYGNKCPGKGSGVYIIG